MGAAQKLLRFGAFGLNLDTEELRKDGTLIRLAPQPFRLLALLAGRAGQVVTREEIQKQIWGDETFVDFEHGMNQCIKQIRGVLNDSAERPVYVETIPRRGYRFLAPVVASTISEASAVVESSSNLQPAVVSVPRLAPGSGPEATLAPAPQTGTFPASEGAATAAAPALEAAPTRPVVRGTRLFRVAMVAAVCIPVIVIGVYWSTRRVSALNEKDTVVLADFTNHTADKVFDDTLKTALSFQLEQSPFLNVLSDLSAAGTLRLMNRPADQPVTGEIARELCLRTNSKAVVAGSIAAVGEHYLIGLKATNCQTGDTLVSAEAEAENLNKVLPALQQAGNQLRTSLGESLASVRKFDQPLEEATTSSLDALQSLTQGRRIQVQGGGAAAIPYFQRAIELDPDFAMAYLYLGTAYYNLNETKLASQNLRKAYELRNRPSQRERLVIEAHYGLATGDLGKAFQTATEWAQSYAGDYQPYSYLAYVNVQLGQYNKAAAEMRESLRLAPSDVDFSNLIGIYIALDQLDMAEAVLKQLRTRKQDGTYLPYEYWYYFAFLKNDDTTMAQQLASAIGKPEAESMMLSVQSDTEAYRGRFVAARDFSQRAVESARRAGAAEMAGGWRANEALREAEVGNFARARQQTAEALALSDGRSVRILAALALARAGETAQAQKLVEQLDQESPNDTIVQGYWLPSIGAATELSKNSPDQAITALEPAATYELGTQPPFRLGPMYPVYLRGLAFLQLGKPQAAATEFQKIVDHPGIAGNFVLAPLAHLQLGRALAMTGDKAGARQQYQHFFDLWKEANADIPIFTQAKAEYAKLI